MMIFPIFVIGISVSVYFVFQNTPSLLDPVVWDHPNALPKLEGVLAPNNLLTVGLQKIKISASNASPSAKYQLPFNGPECISFDNTSGDAFVSMSDGTVAAFNSNGDYKDRIFFTGTFVASPSSLNGLQGPNGYNETLLNWCNNQAVLRVSAWSPSTEKLCGRPLGLRFRIEKGRKVLYILDAYHGLFLLDLLSATATHLVTPRTAIHTLSDASSVSDNDSQLPPMFFNDLDVLDGEVVFSDSSYKFTRSENRREILDGAPRGRLFQYSLESGRLRLVLCGLHFPNGVQLLRKRDGNGGSEVLVAESSRFRVLKVNLNSNALLHAAQSQRCDEKGYLHDALSVHPSSQEDKDATYERFGVAVFYDSAPGIVDNIRLSILPSAPKSTSAPERRFLLALGSKSTQPFSLLWLGYQTIFLRQLIGKFVPMRLVEHLVPAYGLVVEVDASGRPLRSWQDPGGRAVSWISHAERHPLTGALWLGSHSNDFIGILPA